MIGAVSAAVRNGNRDFFRKPGNKIARFLGEMQRVAFRLMLLSCECVCVCVSVCLSVCMPRLWTLGKWFEIETSFFLNCAE